MRSTTSERLKQLMLERNLKQIEILELSKPYQKKLNTKMGKSALSQYISGKSKPDQRKLCLLSETLGVSEPWLMGFNVPREKENDTDTISVIDKIVDILLKLTASRKQNIFTYAENQLKEQTLAEKSLETKTTNLEHMDTI